MNQPTQGLPTKFEDFSLAQAMVYDTNDRRRKADNLAKRQIQELSPLAGALGNEISMLVMGDRTHEDKLRRITSMREIATGQSAAVLVGFTDADAQARLQMSDKLSDGVKRLLERALNPDDPEYIEVDPDGDGTPLEITAARTKIVVLEKDAENTMKYLNGPVRELFEKFAGVLELAPIDNEITEDLRERIKVALDNGAQPVNSVPAPQQPPVPAPPGTAPQPAPAGGSQPPAPPASGNPPAASKGRLAKVAQALKGN